jgi:Ca2+/Na+ antiporter
MRPNQSTQSDSSRPTPGGYRPPRHAAYEEFPSASPRTGSPTSSGAPDSRRPSGALEPSGPSDHHAAAAGWRRDDLGLTAPAWLQRLSGGGGGAAVAERWPAAALAAAAVAGRPGAARALWWMVRREVTMRNCEEWDDSPCVIRLFRQVGGSGLAACGLPAARACLNPASNSTSTLSMHHRPNPPRSHTHQVTFPLLLPLYLALRTTVPFIIPPGYSRPWLLASLLTWPLTIGAYLGLLTRAAWAPPAALAAGALAAAAVGWLTRLDAPGAPPLSGLRAASSGGGAAAAAPSFAAAAAAALPGALSVMGFCVGVAWIDTVAGEVVGALSFLAALASFPSGVVGLTLLAWGNSLGDFFGNRAMARAGHASIATTACFASPLFNMLMSLSLGFGGYLAKLGAGSVAVALTPEVGLGCGFLVVYNLAIIGVGRVCGRLPRWFATFARCWYAAYFVVACASGFGLFNRAAAA